MALSKNIKRRVATVLLIGGVSAILAAPSQAGYDSNRTADSVDTARGIPEESNRPQVTQAGYGNHRIADSVDRARSGARSTKLTQPGYDSNRVADSVDRMRA